MPMVYKTDKLARSFRPGECLAVCCLALRKAGLSYPARTDDDIPVLDEVSNLVVAQCQTKDTGFQDEILSRKPIRVRVELAEVDAILQEDSD